MQSAANRVHESTTRVPALHPENPRMSAGIAALRDLVKENADAMPDLASRPERHNGEQGEHNG